MNKSKQIWFLMGLILVVEILGVIGSNVYLQNKRRMQVSITPTSMPISTEPKDIVQGTDVNVSSGSQVTVKPATDVTSTVQKQSFCNNCKLNSSENDLNNCNSCAYNSNDPSKCNYLIDESDRDTCFEAYHIMKGDLEKYCNTLSTDSGEKDKCLYVLVQENKNVSDCSLIKNDNVSMGCYLSVAETNNDVNICQLSIKDSVTCVAKYASTKETIEPCKAYFLSANEQQFCKALAISLMKKPEMCKSLSNDIDIDSCYLFGVVQNKDYTFCDSAERTVKANCYAYYGWNVEHTYDICLRMYGDITQAADQATCLGYYGKVSNLGEQVCVYYKPTGIANVDSMGISLCTDVANK